MSTGIHPFEKAGLGQAPFQFVGMEEKRGPLPMQDAEGNIIPGAFVGALGQPMGSCDYCGASLAYCCYVRSADGKTFIVGTECVSKTADPGLRREVDQAVKEAKKKARIAREEKRIADACNALADNGNLGEYLRTQPHPYPYMAEEGHTRYSWANWMLANAGHSGCLQVARYIEKAQKTLTTQK